MAKLTFEERLAAAKERREEAERAAQKPKDLSRVEKKRLERAQSKLFSEIERGGQAGTDLDVMLVKKSDFKGGHRLVGDPIGNLLGFLAADTALLKMARHCDENGLRCSIHDPQRPGYDRMWLCVKLP